MKYMLKMAQKCAFTLVATLVAGQAMAQVTFYEDENFQGRSFNADKSVNNFDRSPLQGTAASAVVVGERWEVCDENRFRGRCVVLRPGRYATLEQMSLDDGVASVRIVRRNARIPDKRYAPIPATAVAPAAPPAEIIFFEDAQFGGRSFRTDKQSDNFTSVGFNDRASSALVIAGAWEVCVDSRFTGQCMVLRPGRYGSLSDMGINDRISSTRAVEGNAQVPSSRYAPPPAATVYDSRPRSDERLYTANVTSVRAVVGPPEQRCWLEREAIAPPVAEPQNNANNQNAVIGAILGSILGYQPDAAVQQRDVQRCTSIPSQAAPAFWDVTYTFQGKEHRIQMTTVPGATITVNSNGEPRT